MNVVEMKTSSLILYSVIWFTDCPDDGDAITDYTRTENWEHTTSIYLLQLVPCPLFRDGLSLPGFRPLGKFGKWETVLSTLLEWNNLRIENGCKSCRILSKYNLWAWRNLQVFQILIERCYIIHSCFNWGVSCQILFLRKSSWDEMSETCKPGDAIKIWLDARFARSWQRSLVIAEAGVQVLESGSSRS